MAAKKTIVIVGWILIVLLFATYFAIMLIATFSGDGATPVKLIPGGRGGVQFPVVALPFLMGLILVGLFWLRRVLRRCGSRQRPTRR